MTTTKEFRSAGPGRVTALTQEFAATVMRSSKMLQDKAINAGYVADFIAWQQESFSEPIQGFRKREHLWRAISGRLDLSRPVLVLEFGVAWGYTTATWMELLGDRSDVEWHGFDRFTGLPRAWRDHSEGAFDAGGKPPEIADRRVTWHVGDVEDTLAEVDLSKYHGHQILVIFDLDIYEPSLFAWNELLPHLRSGDLLYFDEAMDADERRLLNGHVLTSNLRFLPIGATPQALSLVIR